METNKEEFKVECYIQNMPNGFWLWLRTGYREEKFICSVNDEESANLICEAFNVANETGLTPSQLHAELEKAKEFLREVKDQLKVGVDH